MTLCGMRGQYQTAGITSASMRFLGQPSHLNTQSPYQQPNQGLPDTPPQQPNQVIVPQELELMEMEIQDNIPDLIDTP